MNLRAAVLTLFVAATLAASPLGKGAWETVERLPAAEGVVQEVPAPAADEVGIRAGSGYIYITLRQPSRVRLFTILGQLISSADLPAGTHRLRLTTRGIYLVKAGSVTRRITL